MVQMDVVCPRSSAGPRTSWAGSRPGSVLSGCIMMPLFSVRPDGRPDVSWDDPSDPRSMLAHFIGSEIYLFLDNATVFLQAVAAVERGEKDAWRWCGNSFSVELNKEGGTITHHWTEPGDP